MATDDPRRFSRWEIGAVAVIGVYFLARQLFFALAIAPGIPPDEPTHLGIIELYSEALFLIQDSPESYSLGLVTHVPFLYHLLMGKLLTINPFGLEVHTYLRLWNVLLSACTVVLAYRLAVELTTNRLARILFLVMLTNTLMYTFIGAAVSYDNLVHLLAVASLYALVRFTKMPGPSALLAFAACVLAGTLTKITLLPLAAILVVVLVVERRTALGSDLLGLVKAIRERRPVVVALGLTAVLALGANLWLYGGNLLRFGRVDPPCDRVLAHESCMENRIYARNWIVAQYRTDAMTLEQAIFSTVRIKNAGDRDHAVRLLRFEQSYKQSRPPALSVWDYMSLVWTQAMKPTIFGVQAHLSILKGSRELLPYNIILFLGLLAWVRRARWTDSERIWVHLGLVVIFYYWFLVGYFNYSNYLVSHAPLLGVQGRYIFPVLVPAYLVTADSLLTAFKKRLQAAVVVLVCAVFIAGDFPYFMKNSGDPWFASPVAADAGPATSEPGDD